MKNYYNKNKNICTIAGKYEKNKRENYCSHCKMAIDFFGEYTICSKGKDDKF